jgi:acyl-CoA synthetase (AMP-forming)/AMP-acid ligase II
MFLKYLGDPKATREAHNGDGYFRTGDIARREGEYYFIQGRISQVTILNPHAGARWLTPNRTS